MRPQTAPTLPFAKSGMSARPAGVAGMFGITTGPKDPPISFGSAMPKGTALMEHALKLHTAYAEVTPSGWLPKEPAIRPSALVTGAGVVSAGSIDNTYLPKPLNNGWGKAWERATNELGPKVHKQATDLLIVAKGAVMPPPSQGLSEMNSVRSVYSKTIPLFHPIDPQRQESGFVRPPNIVPGSQPPPISPMFGVEGVQCVPADHKLRKLAFDQSMHGTGRIPVMRVVRNTLPRPATAAPTFLTRAAGLSGGLSLTAA